MNILDHFLNVHRQTEDMFARLESLQESAAKRKLVEQLVQALIVHEGVEETLFYPVLDRLQKDQPLAREGLEQQQELRDFIRRERVLQLPDDQLDPVLRRLKRLVMEHVQTEEARIFPTARRQIDAAELDRLGNEVERVRSEQREQALRLTVTMLPESPVEQTQR